MSISEEEDNGSSPLLSDGDELNLKQLTIETNEGVARNFSASVSNPPPAHGL